MVVVGGLQKHVCHYNKQVQEISPSERLDIWRRKVRKRKTKKEWPKEFEGYS